MDDAHKIKQYPDPELDRQIEELCSLLREAKAILADHEARIVALEP